MALEESSIWRTLGIAPTGDSTEIRRAYAKRLRAVHPEDDPEGFNELRLAYEAAAGWARLSHLRSIEEDLQSTTPGRPVARAFEDQTSPSPSRPPLVDSMTIDQMLDELALDERREPELDRLRQELALTLRPEGSSDDRMAALDRIFRSDAMKSSRLYAETESWVALLLRGSFPETEALIEPSVAFFAWGQTVEGYLSPHGDRVLQRRDALALRDALNDPKHRLHKAYIALQRPFLDSYAVQYGLTFGLHRRVEELMRTVDGNREFECLLDQSAVVWWRRHLRGPGRGPVLFLGMVLVPFALAKLTTASDYSDYDGTTFIIVWLAALCGYLLMVGVLVAITRYIRQNKAPSGSWIEELGDAAP